MSIVFSGHQPNFAPYLGFFYKMYKSDVFVFDDDVQYSSHNWTNKNYLKVSGKRTRITIPVKANFGDLINQVKIDYTGNWRQKLRKTLEMNYGKAYRYFEGMKIVEAYILSGEYELLSEMNICMITEIARKFGFRCKLLTASKELHTDLQKNERNIWQAKQVCADVYYSGDGGREYNDEEAYRMAGISIVYSDYQPKSYRQADRTGFIEDLSVLDYIFNHGYVLPEAFADGEKQENIMQNNLTHDRHVLRYSYNNPS